MIDRMNRRSERAKGRISSGCSHGYSSLRLAGDRDERSTRRCSSRLNAGGYELDIRSQGEAAPMRSFGVGNSWRCTE